MSRALAERERRPLDDYPTPNWAADAILPHLPLDGTVLEPACGAGAIVGRLLAHGVAGDRIRGLEYDSMRAEQARGAYPDVTVVTGDALDGAPGAWGSPHLIITNPPYRQAEAFARRALAVIPPRGCVAMLLRLAFLESAARYDFHREFPVTALHVFTSRPSFTGDGKSDSAAYAWFVWGGPERGIHFIPPHERKRGAA